MILSRPQNHRIHPQKKDTINWPLFILFLISFLFFIFLSIKVYQYNPSKQPLADKNVTPGKPIRGWLILLSAGILFSPIFILRDLWETLPIILSYNNWLVIADTTQETFNPFQVPFIILSLMLNTAIIIFSALNIFLFFMKKRYFPNFI